ncbi:MAG: Hydrogen cyanide synthase subunit HcnC [Alphaproteobacteria bacterium MarineAlpha4_Bin2]|nr:MAG: Hydrogen cyanide synthase subunit HcnC [Alphaproteobacteria bacterium MarineAlpha4_Bin2]
MESSDVIVVGGGLFGPATAFGLRQHGLDTVILDDGDNVLRAARGNFGLVWVQSKGMGMHRYHAWSRESSELYGDFAAELKEKSGVGIAHRNEGGMHLLLGEKEREQRRREMDIMRQQAGADGFECEIIEREEVEKMLPGVRLGNDVVGASFSEHDGDVNPLKLLRALHTSFQQMGGRYRSDCRVETIRHDGSAFIAETRNGTFTAPKIVLACGHGITRLAPMVGLDTPIVPQRGQVLVTERAEPMLSMALGTVRQTDEGTVQIGNTEEEAGYDESTTLSASQAMARRAVALFPQLAGLRLNRTWGCIRVLTPDKCAIYDESDNFPGAYVTTSHSGVTLAAVNARRTARWIATGETPPGFEEFSAKRFKREVENVPAHH